MTKLKIKKISIQRCPACRFYGIVWQPYGMKCVFCGYVEYFKKTKSSAKKHRVF